MTKKRIEVHPQALREVDDAFEYYRQRNLKAADSFLVQLSKARVAIQDSPEAWPPYLHGTRSYLLKRYPYLLVYHLGEERVEIIVDAHAHRKPGYWFNRLRPQR